MIRVAGGCDNGDIVALTQIQDIPEAFFLGIEGHGCVADAECAVPIMIIEMIMKKSHPDEPHADITTDEAFHAFIENMIGHIFHIDIDATRTAQCFPMGPDHVLPHLGHEDVFQTFFTLSVFRTRFDVFFGGGNRVLGTTDTLPHKFRTPNHEMVVQFGVEITDPVVTIGTLDHTSRQTPHVQKINLIGRVPVQ